MCTFPSPHDRENYTGKSPEPWPAFHLPKDHPWHLPLSVWILRPRGAAGLTLINRMLCPDAGNPGLSHACRNLLEAGLGSWLSIPHSGPHALVRLYYFLSSNCHFQLIISLWRENNIGSYVIATSMNLEAIMEWVDFFPSLKKREGEK